MNNFSRINSYWHKAADSGSYKPELFMAFVQIEAGDRLRFSGTEFIPIEKT